jgi:hypothetical protein
MMVGSSTVISTARSRALRFIVITFLIVNPAQTIDIEAVVGLDLQRPLDQTFASSS